ncbi:myotilin isoform X2 [Pungitius pungitius]|uniref:myotilin isoform X2 n=1 Tax=Pungitius pungitius TaxID=134920 RepID=UPI002E0F8F54
MTVSFEPIGCTRATPRILCSASARRHLALHPGGLSARGDGRVCVESGADTSLPQAGNHSFEEHFGCSEEVLSSGGQRSPGVTVGAYTPSPTPPPSQVKELTHTPKLFSPTKLSFPPGGPTMNLSDLPSFTPSVFPPSAFNYERPRHFIQSQAAFQAPSYDSVLREAQENQNSSQQNLSSFQDSPNPTETQSRVNATPAQPQSFSQTQSVSESSSQSQAQLQSRSLSQSQVQSRSLSQSQVQSQSLSQSQVQSRSLSQSQVQSQSLSQSQVQSQSLSQSQVQSQSLSQSQVQSQSLSQSQVQSQSLSQSQVQSQAQTEVKTQVQIQTQANGMGKSSSSSISSPISPQASSAAPPQSSLAPMQSAPASTVPASISLLPRTTMRSTITLTPSIPSATGLGSATLPANQDAMSAPAAYLCSVLPSQSGFSSSKLSPNSTRPHFPTSPSRSPPAPRSPLLPARGSSSGISLPQQPLAVSPCLPGSPLSPSSSSLQQPNTSNGQSRVPPAVVSLPASYKAAPSILPKPILKKAVAPRPSSSRSTDEDIQGSKDALIQDLEKKLRSKEARRRNCQKLSYEERMARRLLGPDNANYTLDQDSLSDSHPDQFQPDSPEGRHTGGLWGRRHTGTDERGNEGSAIQEKCYAPRFLQVPPDLTVEEGRFCRIDFKVGGLPTPDVCWYLDGKAIRPDDFHKMLVSERGMHSFLIEIVTVHHAGVYECVARNRAGEARFSMRLDVLAQEALRPPTFVQKMSNSRALEGDTVRLECKVDASPPPQLFWKKDKDMLRIDPNRMSLYQDGSGRQCLLLERLLKSDAGWYTLSAINEAGMSTCNARLDVGTRTAPPMKTAPPGSKTLKMLSSLSHVPTRTVESPAQHTAPLYESEEL